MSSSPSWTEARVTDALRALYLPGHQPLSTEEWAFLTQVPLRCPRPGHTPDTATYWTTNERRIDALLVRNWSGGRHGHERVAIEIKVSRADYRNETDLKRAPAEASAHRCAYAAPAGIIDPASLPTGWGLIEVAEDGRATWTRRAKRRDPDCDLDYLVSAGFRRASRAEERIRRGEEAAAEVTRLREEVARLTGAAERATAARDREQARAKAARDELLAFFGGTPACATCEQRLTWRRGGSNDSRWVHTDRSVEVACRERRMAAWRQARARGADEPYPSDPVPADPAAADG